LTGEALRTARRAAQIVFQDPFASLNPRMRVNEILEEGVASLRPDIAGSIGTFRGPHCYLPRRGGCTGTSASR